MIDIKQTASRHSVSLDQWGWGESGAGRWSILNKLLNALSRTMTAPPTVGKKRYAEDADTHGGPSKRQKFTDVTNGIRVKTEDGEEVVLRSLLSSIPMISLLRCLRGIPTTGIHTGKRLLERR
jgi:hypothetical protein